MSEKLKGLLEKINKEGVTKAEEKARAIESKAAIDAKNTLEHAKKEAQGIIEAGKSEAHKRKETTEIVLRQASRDLILSLKDEIKKILNKIIALETNKAMSRDDMIDIVRKLIEKYIEKNGKTSDIKVLLKKEDLEKLKGTFIAKLKEQLKEGMEFKVSPNISAGFSISFDKGKSFFDFTDEGLQEALSSYLNPELAKLLKL